MSIGADPKLQIKISATNEDLKQKLREADSTVNSFGKNINLLKNIGSGLVGAFAVDQIINKFREWQTAAEETTRVHNQMTAIIKATGGAAGLTADEIENMASAFQELTGIDDETIKGAQNILLTFRNIGGDIFPQTTQAMLDMSSVMGQDLNSAALQVGKALNDPLEGLTALKRVGVAFTDDQKKIIEGFIKQGDVVSAQKIILEELSKEFGNAASAAKTSSQEASVAIGEFNEAVGKLFKPAGDSMLSWFSKVTNSATQYIDKLRIINTETSKLGLSDITKKQQELRNNISEYEAKYGKYDLKSGKFNMPDSKGFYWGKTDYSPTLAKNYERMKKELSDSYKIAKDLTKEQEKVHEVGRNYTKQVSLPTEKKARNKKDKATSEYESFAKTIKGRMIEVESQKEAEKILSQFQLDNTSELYKKINELTVNWVQDRKEIEMSGAKNKNELLNQLDKSYKLQGEQEINQLLKEDQQKRSEELAEQERNAQEQEVQNALDVTQYRNKLILDAEQESARRQQEIWQKSFDRIFDHSLTWQQKMVGIIEEILMYEAKAMAIQALTPLKGSEGFLGTIAKYGLMLAGTFADGGDPPVGKVSLVGERGPELFVPKTPGTIIPNDQLGGGQQAQNIVIALNPTFKNLDPNEGQKSFEKWMKSSGLQMITQAVKNNNNGLRQTIKAV